MGYPHFATECSEYHFLLVEHLRKQIEWSRNTFGPENRVHGICDHIRKEVEEVIASNGSLKEWIDIVILGFDGAWRSGASPEQIIAELVAKMERNYSRTWPDWRTMPSDKAIEHVRHVEEDDGN